MHRAVVLVGVVAVLGVLGSASGGTPELAAMGGAGYEPHFGAWAALAFTLGAVLVAASRRRTASGRRP